MTKEGKAFISRWQMVEKMLANGASPFTSVACGLSEDDDWLLVVAAMRRMCKEIKEPTQ